LNQFCPLRFTPWRLRRNCVQSSGCAQPTRNEGERAMVIRVMLIGVCGLTLAGCASYLPSISGFFQSSPKTEQLRIDSDPAGAEAKSSEGTTCQTPCELSVSSGSDFSVAVSMLGYQTLTVPVGPDSSGGQLRPNPVFAKLQPLTPPQPARRPSAKKKSLQASTTQ
jgi:hypothetical protein